LREEVGALPNFEAAIETLRDRGVLDEYERGTYHYEDLVADFEMIEAAQRNYVRSSERGTLPPGPQRGEEVRSPEADLTDYELECMYAVSEYYALAATWRSQVRLLRERLLSNDLLSPEEARELLTANATSEGIDLEYLDAEGRIATITVSQASNFKRLKSVSSLLAREYGWHDAEAAHFILTGEHSLIPAITGKRSLDTITIYAAPYVSAKTVSDFYRELRQRSGRSGTTQPKGVRVLRTVLDYVWREGVPPDLNELRKLWNQRHPDETFSRKREFEKAYEAAFKAIIKPLEKLPDVYGIRDKLPGF
jgi:hypothetical protein